MNYCERTVCIVGVMGVAVGVLIGVLFQPQPNESPYVVNLKANLSEQKNLREQLIQERASLFADKRELLSGTYKQLPLKCIEISDWPEKGYQCWQLQKSLVIAVNNADFGEGKPVFTWPAGTTIEIFPLTQARKIQPRLNQLRDWIDDDPRSSSFIASNADHLQDMLQEGAEPGSGNEPPAPPRKFPPKSVPTSAAKPFVEIHLADDPVIILRDKTVGREITVAEYEKLDRFWFVPACVIYDLNGHAKRLELAQLYIVDMQDIEGFTLEQRTDGRWYESETGEFCPFTEVQDGNGNILDRWLMPIRGGQVAKKRAAKVNNKGPEPIPAPRELPKKLPTE